MCVEHKNYQPRREREKNVGCGRAAQLAFFPEIIIQVAGRRRRPDPPPTSDRQLPPTTHTAHQQPTQQSRPTLFWAKLRWLANIYLVFEYYFGRD